MRVGIDIGSTTVKMVCFDEFDNILFKKYKRHLSKIEETLIEIMEEADKILNFESIKVTIAGSAGMDIAKRSGVEFTQEVIAATLAVEHFLPHVDSVIEIGGEDVKVIFFDTVIDQRMNSTCAGGTGAFIDQMSKLLDMTPTELNEIAKKHDKIYPIASRCGVFAKTDIQSLINQGVIKENIAISIFQAVVNQTIAGLAQGREFKGKVCFLGGPLTFFSELRDRFAKTLNLDSEGVVFPENSEYFIAMGCGLFAGSVKEVDYSAFKSRIALKEHNHVENYRLEPLFKNSSEKDLFMKRHYKDDLVKYDIGSYKKDITIGIDAGSTTTKIVVLGEQQELLYSYYNYNKGSVIETVKDQLIHILKEKNPKSNIYATGVTGYGEELLKEAFSLDTGEVETIAHFEAAKYFMNDVDFIIDIGGQDMKCLKIKNGMIESIVLNEACSSGCGSFISTFANSLGHQVEDFATMALESNNPVDLGSRCTIFMNSSVKQAQKEGAKVSDISSGLAISVVKNALYKVLRMNSASELGNNIVVQGGTFYNDAILRAFEKETGATCIRPSIAGLMGAFGVALIAQKRQDGKSIISSEDDIANLKVKNSVSVCKGCSNNCTLTVSAFTSGKKYVSGNRCELGLGKQKKENKFDLFKYKLEYLESQKTGKYQDKIGMPFVMNMYENLPFWMKFFDKLSIEAIVTSSSSRSTYEKGQHTIPSDTACYPAKIVHGHIEELIDLGVDKVFYPCIVYNFKEKNYPKNHYNCPVVASYSEVIYNNVDKVRNLRFSNPYMTLNDKKAFVKAMEKELERIGLGRKKRDIAKAYDEGLISYNTFKKDIIDYGNKAEKYAIDNNKKIIVLSGRPYHIDPEINHGINDLLASMDVVILTEDCVNRYADNSDSKVLNQWTYHTRLYDAAKYVANHDYDMINLVQLVSFGCGLDAITTDEVGRILEENEKIYTQIKIDEMSNLGAVKIRLRSLLSTIDEKRRC